MPIRAVVFDIGGILEITPETGWQKKWEARLTITFQELFGKMKSTGRDGSLGTCSEEEWLRGLREISGMNQTQTDEFMEDFWVWYLGTLNAELTDYFRDLRPGYQTAILSNSFLGARAKEQALYGFEDITDVIIYSHEVGMAKPDPRIYALTCEKLGVQANEIVFLDDLEENIIAAREFGMQAVWFKDNTQAIAEIEVHLQAT
jgi:epoxide hydrolase-like predicted phosphatase